MTVYLDANNWITENDRNAVAKAEITNPAYNSIKQCFEYQILFIEPLKQVKTAFSNNNIFNNK